MLKATFLSTQLLSDLKFEALGHAVGLCMDAKFGARKKLESRGCHVAIERNRDRRSNRVGTVHECGRQTGGQIYDD